MANIIDNEKILNDEQLDSVAGGFLHPEPIQIYRCLGCGREWGAPFFPDPSTPSPSDTPCPRCGGTLVPDGIEW